MKKYFKLLRVEQWVKNLFVFVPLFFSGNIKNIDLLSKSIFAFIIFSLAASAVYILNDYNDIEADKKHPEKRRRPLASGAISKSQAIAIFIGLIAADIALVFFSQAYFQQNLWKFATIITSYFLMNLAYTFRLKHVPIIDISIIALGFVLRVLAGGYITGISISQWAILLTFVLALVLAIGKRRGELINAQISGKTRKALDGYNVQFADIALSISVTLAIVCYLMFTLSPEVQAKFHQRVFFTVIFVVFAFLRYLQQTLVYNRTESPTKIVYRDRYIQVTLLLWVAAFLIQIYFKKMKPDFVQKVTNWGNYPIVEKEMRSEDSFQKIKEFVLTHNEVIARGNGRCYGDASLGEYIFSTKKLNKFISFDRLKGIIECESGVLLSDVLEIAVPQGYFPYVTPGTKFVSVGGAIASDVHGKNHHSEGCFSEYVIEFKLMIENGDIITCSREENSEKFWSTIGGMGLTGIILTAKFRLKNIQTAYIRQESIKAENLDEIFRLFEESESWTYNVAWIDCLQKGKHIGRSILMRGEHAFQHELPQKFRDQPLRLKKKFEPKVPFYFPGFVLNAFTVKIFNYFYFKKQSKKEVTDFIDYETFFYPLDFVKDWNRIYGKSGFIQYQMMIPKEKGKEGMRKILETIANSGNGSFLAVLKLYGKENPHAYNSFPFEGYSLALDFKVNSKLRKLIDRLDDIVEEYHGKIYLTKDSMSRSSLTNYLKNVQSSKFVSLQHKRIINNS